MYKLLIIVGLQAVCLQNAYSQAINHQSTDTVTEIIEAVDSLVIQPNNIVDLTVNQPPQPICPQCGRPAHLCDCGCLAVTVSDSYSSVANQPNDKPQTICPHCGLSAELCICGALPEVAETIFTVNQPNNQTVCSKCGLPAELCKCGFFPLVAVSETSEVNHADSGSCPNCGQPVELCKCGFLSEVSIAETAVGQPELPQTMCPFCGLPVERCTCQA